MPTRARTDSRQQSIRQSAAALQAVLEQKVSVDTFERTNRWLASQRNMRCVKLKEAAEACDYPGKNVDRMRYDE